MRTAQEEGLHQATGTLEKYFYLDRLASGEKATVNLYVGLDGETQGNAYQDTLAKLQMNFAVEKVRVDSPTVIKRGSNTVTVQTGDTTPIILLSILALASGCVILFVAAKQMKERRKEEEQS